jgi:hypothetical protein
MNCCGLRCFFSFGTREPGVQPHECRHISFDLKHLEIGLRLVVHTLHTTASEDGVHLRAATNECRRERAVGRGARRGASVWVAADDRRRTGLSVGSCVCSGCVGKGARRPLGATLRCRVGPSPADVARFQGQMHIRSPQNVQLKSSRSHTNHVPPSKRPAVDRRAY